MVTAAVVVDSLKALLADVPALVVVKGSPGVELADEPETVVVSLEGLSVAVEVEDAEVAEEPTDTDMLVVDEVVVQGSLLYDLLDLLLASFNQSSQICAGKRSASDANAGLAVDVLPVR